MTCQIHVQRIVVWQKTKRTYMSSQAIAVIIKYASIFSVAFPLILYLIRAKDLSRHAHMIGAMIVISAISDGVGYFVSRAGTSTAIIFNSYFVISFLLLCWFYHSVAPAKSGKNLVRWGVGIFILAYVCIASFVQPITQFQTLMWTTGGAIGIVFSISYFISVFSATRPMNDFGLLWINSGILFYFSFNLFLFLMSSYVYTHFEPEVGIIFWSFHNVNNVIKNILIGLGLSTARTIELDMK
jgi:hypothetical protein